MRIQCKPDSIRTCDMHHCFDQTEHSAQAFAKCLLGNCFFGPSSDFLDPGTQL